LLGHSVWLKCFWEHLLEFLLDTEVIVGYGQNTNSVFKLLFNFLFLRIFLILFFFWLFLLATSWSLFR
jgi:hypothetical protein